MEGRSVSVGATLVVARKLPKCCYCLEIPRKFWSPGNHQNVVLARNSRKVCSPRNHPNIRFSNNHQNVVTVENLTKTKYLILKYQLEIIADNRKGQPQGIAPTDCPDGLASTGCRNGLPQREPNDCPFSLFRIYLHLLNKNQGNLNACLPSNSQFPFAFCQT